MAINTTGNHPYLVKPYSKEKCDKYVDDVWNKDADIDGLSKKDIVIDGLRLRI